MLINAGDPHPLDLLEEFVKKKNPKYLRQII
jgi:hypothetical protein